jgi:hypothetical protein
MTDRAEGYRKQALNAESKAFNARSKETRRAWQIIARDWTKMADREEARANRPQREFDAEQLIGLALTPEKQAE